MNTDQNYSLLSPSWQQSLALGTKLAKILELGDLVEFVGDLGGGKTTIIKGLAAGLGITQTVTSPTYNIQRSYKIPTGGKLEHYDLYRLGEDEVLLQEMREIIATGDSIICVEWADHFSQHLSADRFVVKLTFIDETSRQINITATGPKSKRKLAKIEPLKL